MDRRFVEKVMKENLNILTRQQVRTLKGQLNSGNIEGAYKGLIKLVNKTKVRKGGCVKNGK